MTAPASVGADYSERMPTSPYVQSLRSQVGHGLILLPGVTAVIRRDERFLLARQRDTELWSLIGGGIEPGEEPAHAVQREVEEELGLTPIVGPIVGAYGGADLRSVYPNGDEVSYVTIAYACELPHAAFELEQAELIEVAWYDLSVISALPRHGWIDRVLRDAAR
ncbi:NUDIX domain-containing protein [Plantibacter sp. RU18]|uniref:NUDIX domain-containing protein n=2 Tax=unclassified Plantibacter TaxID=2624265 RepID=UPI003D35A2DA